MAVRALNVNDFMDDVVRRSPNEPEFHQAVREVAESVIPFINEHPVYLEHRILDRLTEPDRVISFRVCWEDDEHRLRINRGYRIQFNGVLGPYKGGLRFVPGLALGTLKFLGFEQILKNSLTTLPLGGGKGGADFDPKGKSDGEVMRFCHAFMTELYRHIGDDCDVPAGDMGVGAREIGYLFGQYRRLGNAYNGALTGKGIEYGGSLIRKEATGYGAVFFVQEMLCHQQRSLEGLRCVVSGTGNVALYGAQKLLELGAKVVAMSDSGGSVHIPDGMGREELAWLKELKEVRRGRISEFAEHFHHEYYRDVKVWQFPCEVALACATQNELEPDDARQLIHNGCKLVAEGANMPTTLEATRLLQKAGVLFAPGKAANAGGVAVSGLEMAQNSMHMSWSEEEVEHRLLNIMKNIHQQCLIYGQKPTGVDYVDGANIAGFCRVADTMMAYGVM
ncbi:NADP-specific glutamate dehydrogenase [invertebrate metagenome]|uniref:NADP-specific glutamate dehydrogenase n=1 Tax=invertebrate metagenome TaxID=1711999 RepID=A0A2H9TCB6_9ZZZZ